MLSDRSYLRGNYQQRNTSMVVWLIASVVAAFLLELLFRSSWFPAGQAWIDQLQLTIRGMQSGRYWTLLTHGFLHSLENPFHLLFTILSVIFIGRELEPLLGGKRFLTVYLTSLVVGGLCWTATHWSSGGIHIGASAGVLGIFTVLACLYPNQEIKFLALFLFPVTVRPKYLLYGLVALNAFGFVVYELMGNPPPWNYAPSVQLAGMLVGWVYFRYFHANNGWDRAPSVQLPGLKREKKVETAMVAPVEPQPIVAKPMSARNLRAEVDVILDKINSEGFGALTDEEKNVLDAAKDLLSRP